MKAALLLDIAQPDVSHLMNGYFSRFTTDKLLDFLKRLEQEDAKPASHLAQYAGTISLTEDPLVFQERMRREW
jgi:hypothetical protein